MTLSPRLLGAGLAFVVIHVPAFATAGSWTRAYVNALPDEAFAVVDSGSAGTKLRHLPHHDAEGRLDLPHLRSALARLDQVHWKDPADAERARQHLLTHRDARSGRRRTAPSWTGGRSR